MPRMVMTLYKLPLPKLTTRTLARPILIEILAFGVHLQLAPLPYIKPPKFLSFLTGGARHPLHSPDYAYDDKTIAPVYAPA